MTQRGHLVRAIPVRLLDFSWSGCRVLADAAVAPGTKGELRVEVDGSEHCDPVQIVRQAEHHGSSHPFTLGGTFVWGARENATSVRTTMPSIVTIP